MSSDKVCVISKEKENRQNEGTFVKRPSESIPCSTHWRQARTDEEDKPDDIPHVLDDIIPHIFNLLFFLKRVVATLRISISGRDAARRRCPAGRAGRAACASIRSRVRL